MKNSYLSFLYYIMTYPGVNMKNNKLKIGLILDSEKLPAWSYRMIESLIQLNFIDIELVIDRREMKVCRNISEGERFLSRGVSNLFQKIDEVVGSTGTNLFKSSINHVEDACEEMGGERILSGIVKICACSSITNDNQERFLNESLNDIKRFDLDVIVYLGNRQPCGEILDIPKFGVWIHTHGKQHGCDINNLGFWEFMSKKEVTLTGLKVLSNKESLCGVLHQSTSSTNVFSVQDNASNSLWKLSTFVPLCLKRLFENGSNGYLKSLRKNRYLYGGYSSAKSNGEPNGYLKFYSLLLTLYRKTKHRLVKNRIHWGLMFNLGHTGHLDFSKFEKLVPDPSSNTGWADPFIVYRNNRYYIFFEEIVNRKGRLSYVEMNESGCLLTEPNTVLDLEYHLSYPFIFDFEGDTYLLPESGENLTLDLYRCKKFPNEWEHVTTILQGQGFYDATLFHYNDKWWLFTNIRPTKGASDWDELHLFYNDNLLDGRWIEHPMNPIISDVTTSRPGGAIFIHEGKIIRPSQNCSVRYGYGINFNEILVLNEHIYEERVLSQFNADWDPNIIAMHSYSKSKNLTVIDAQFID